MRRNLNIWLSILLGLTLLSCNKPPTSQEDANIAFNNPYADAINKNTTTVDVYVITENGDTLQIYSGANLRGPWEKSVPKGTFTLVIIQKDSSGVALNQSMYEYTFTEDGVRIKAKIAINPRKLSIPLNHTGYKLEFKVFPSATAQIVAWESRKPGIAEINDSGIVLPKSLGVVYVLAKFPGISSDSIEVTIVDSSGIKAVPVQITRQPEITVKVIEGDPVLISLTASGTDLQYEWRQENSVLTGESNSELRFGSAKLSQNGATFTCRVFNTISQIISDASVLTVTPKLVEPTILREPSPVKATEGTSAKFTVSAAGTNLSYQWFRNNIEITGSIESEYVVPSVTAPMDGDRFFVTVSNSVGKVNSDTVQLSFALIIEKPLITGQPDPVQINQGEIANFVVKASGTNLGYQWFKNDVIMLDKTGFKLLFAAKSEDSGSVYTCRVANTADTVFSNKALLQVSKKVIAPSILTSPPIDLKIAEGQSAVLTVTAAGTDLKFQWLKNGVKIIGAEAATYQTGVLSVTDAGSIFICQVSNSLGTVSTPDSKLVIELIAPAITTQPKSLIKYLGDTATFTVVATGTNKTYQWLKGTLEIIGETKSTLILNGITAAQAGEYFVKVTNSKASITSLSANLTVSIKPSIKTPPASVIVNEDTKATFTVVAEGTEPLAYQWLKNGVLITGASTPSYTTPLLTKEDNGDKYSVAVSSTLNSIESAPAILTVRLKPVIITGPVSQSLNLGQTATFSVTVSDEAFKPLTYQWKINGVNVGISSATYTTPTLKLTDNGTSYSVDVSNIVGSASSASAGLTVKNIAPIAPSGLTVVKNGIDSITLDWIVDASKYELGFYIERSTSAVSGFTQVAETIAGINSYKDKGLQIGTIYYYRIRAFNAVGPSAYTSIVSAKTWSCGENFIDARDNKTYGTVSFKGKCWMNQNMNFEVSGQTSCYGNLATNCVKFNQKWYTLSGANQACPEKFHLPSQAELELTYLYDGFTSGCGPNVAALFSKTGFWELPVIPTNTSGMSMLATGESSNGSSWSNIGFGTALWVKSQIFLNQFTAESVEGCRTGTSFTSAAYASVRCIKD